MSAEDKHYYYIKKLVGILEYYGAIIKGGIEIGYLNQIMNETKHFRRAKYFSAEDKALIHEAREIIRAYRRDPYKDECPKFKREVWDLVSKLERASEIL